MIYLNRKIIGLLALGLLFVHGAAVAQTINLDARALIPRVEVSVNPRSGSFVEGSTFEVPILINSKGQSINGVEIRISFDKNKLSVVNPTNGKSIISVWTQAPVYDNTNGTVFYSGVVPGGVTTESGLVATIIFKAKSPGRAGVSINTRSKVLLNDGLGTETVLDLVRADYDILVKSLEGVEVFSETHPIQSNWYNNNNPTISWVKGSGVTDFSFILDNIPSTVPDNIGDSSNNTKTFENLHDGLWYFHIKSFKDGTWGNTGNFLIRIDTTPPSKFKPEVNYLVAATVLVQRTLLSFNATDNLSGIDHYEVGIIDKNQPATESPVFVEAISPFQVPLDPQSKLQVIVRAIDRAGNIRDASIDVRAPLVITKFIKDYIVYILLLIILLGLVMLVLHYLFGHHIIRHAKRILEIIKKEDRRIDDRINPEP